MSKRKCRVCGERSAIAFVRKGNSIETPSQMEDYWKVCVGDTGIWIHNAGVNDWSDHFSEKTNQSEE